MHASNLTGIQPAAATRFGVLPAAAIAVAVAFMPSTRVAHAETAADGAMCTTASSACFHSFTPPGAHGTFRYYASMPPASDAPWAAPIAPTSALIALHGHPRDVGRTFDAAITATRGAGRLHETLVIAPLFQVAQATASRCRSADTPPAQVDDIVWTCSSWMQGATGHWGKEKSLNSFAMLDALINEVHQRYPTLKTITLFGFSAGAQAVQHYIGFSDPGLPADVRLRFVVSDPGTWLYFDAYRPFPVADSAQCPSVNDWKYGINALPSHLSRTGAQARAHYARAEVHYMQGERDTGTGRAAYYKVLDKSCAAQAQGTYRLERGLAYADYDRKMIAPDQHRQVTIVPNCGHKVECVLPSAQARPVVFPE